MPAWLALPLPLTCAVISTGFPVWPRPDLSAGVKKESRGILSVRVLSGLFHRLFLMYLQEVFDSGNLQFFSALVALRDPQAFSRHIAAKREMGCLRQTTLRSTTSTRSRKRVVAVVVIGVTVMATFKLKSLNSLYSVPNGKGARPRG